MPEHNIPQLLKQYKTKNKNIPFELEKGVYRVRFKVSQDTTSDNNIIEQAADDFITYFLPEYYIHVKNSSQADSDFRNAYTKIREFFTSNIEIENPGYDTTPPTNDKIVVTRIEIKKRDSFFTEGKCIRFRTPIDLRASLQQKGLMPDFEKALHFFNDELSIAGRPGSSPNNIGGISEFELSNIEETSDTFSEVMEDLAKQKLGYSGPANLAGVDFNFANIAIRKVIDIVLKQIITQIPEASQGSFNPGDKVSFLFSQKGEADPLSIFVKDGVAGLLLSTSETGTDYVKVGYFSNIKHRRIFDDPVILSTIKNYQSIFNSMEEARRNGRRLPISDFLSQTLPEDTLDRLANDNLFVFNTDNPDADNLLIQEAQRQGLIDVSNNDDLKNGISALTAEEQQRIKEELENNPEFAERVYQQKRRAKLRTAVNVAEIVSQIAETGMPFAKGSAIDTIMEKLGIKALAREALICLTFGMNVSVARIAAAIQDVQEEELNERPAFDLEDFEIFKIKGDFAKIILDIILNSIQQALFALISGFAELLAQLCDIDNPGSDDYGQTPFGNLVLDNLVNDPNDPSSSLLQSPDGLLGTGLGGAVNQLFPPGLTGLEELSSLVGGCPTSDILNYLNDLSSILNSIDICNLMLSEGNVSADLLDRILEFNESYNNPCISENLNSPNAVMAFFQLLGQLADVTEFCNDIANQVIVLNPEICKCLDPDTLSDLSLPEQKTFQDLLDTIENGLTPEPGVPPGVPPDVPPSPRIISPLDISFDCPEAENYLEDPVMKRLIPETFNTLLELIELQFIYSAESIKQALLEKVLVPASENNTFNNATATGDDGQPNPYSNSAVSEQNNPEDYPELPKPDKKSIKRMKMILQKVVETLEDLREPDLENAPENIVHLYEAFQACVIDQPNLLRPEIRNIGTVIDILLQIISNSGFQDAMNDLADNLGDIAESADNSTALISTYRFKKRFARQFADYIRIPPRPSAGSSRPEFKFIEEPAKHELTIYRRFRGTTTKAGSEPRGPTTIQDLVESATIQAAPDCLDQAQINNILNFGGTVPQGRGCPGTTHGEALPPLEDRSGAKNVQIRFLFRNYRNEGAWDSIRLNYRTTSESQNKLKESQRQIAYDLNELFDYSQINEETDVSEYLSTEFIDTKDLDLNIIKFVTSTKSATLPKPNPHISRDYNRVLRNSAEKNYFKTISVLFPYCYGILTEQIFDYYRENGIFDAASLLSMQLFQDNKNCPPEEIADFLDVDGIYKQLREEYLEAACSSEGEPRERLQATVQFGLMLLLIQVHIAEFILKNIFVFGAVRVDQLFNSNLMRSYFRNQVDFYIERFFDSAPLFLDDPRIAKDPTEAIEKIKLTLVELFNRKINREITEVRGGILDEEGVVVFPLGTEFVLEKSSNEKDNVKDFKDIIDFLITTRFQYSTGIILGEERFPGPIVSAIEKSLPAAKSPKSMEEIFLGSMPTYHVNDGELLQNMIKRGSYNRRSRNYHKIKYDIGNLRDDLTKPKFFIIRNTLAANRTPTAIEALEESTGEASFAPASGGSSAFARTWPNELGDWLGSRHRSGRRPSTPTIPPTGFEDISDIPGIDNPAQFYQETEINTTMYYRFMVWIPQFYGLTNPLPLINQQRNTGLIELFSIDVTYENTDRVLWQSQPLNSYSMEKFDPFSLTQTEKNFIINHPVYKDYFTNVFNKEVISMIPILQNYYLGKQHLSGIEDAMLTTKAQIITTLQSVNSSGDEYDSTPDLSRPSARTAGLSMTGPNPDTLARDFIIRMLIQTPIEILKSLMEMIDPHVLITKIIRQATGQAFNIMLDTASTVDLPSPGDYGDDESSAALAPFSDNATGENLVLSLICFLNYYMQNPPTALPAPPNPPFPDPPPPPNFFPTISEKGIDLTGKGMGMLMIPPTPFGLIYFLLSLIKFDNANQPNININVTGDGTENANTAGIQQASRCDDVIDIAEDVPDTEEDC